MELNLQEFEENGFVIIDNHFTRQEMFYLAMILDSLHEMNITDKYDTICQTPEFLRLVCKIETMDIVSQILEQPSAYLFTPRMRIDPPNDNRRTYGWHQEVFYSIPKSRFVQTWAPLIYDTTKENGTIEVCVGSHKEGIAKQTWLSEEGKADQIIVDPEIVAKYEQRVIEMKLGQLLIFDPHLFHRSGQNTSNKTRYSMVCQYHDTTNFKPAKTNFSYDYSPKQYFEDETRTHL